MILITEPDFIPDEEKFINAFFNEGLEILHLRKPEATALQMHELISKIDEKFHSRIMIHSHYELFETFKIRGVHFTENSKGQIRSYEKVQCKKSLAVHELSDLKCVDNSIDYVFLSPLFSSVSKAGYSKQWNFESIKAELSEYRNFKVMALGGITLDNVKQVKELGFDDFALLGSIWEPVKSGCELSHVIEIFNRFQNEK
ncbi:MAG: thiamine phosphate synthase [Paludibacter sp.]|jgi:thiamine-phosphate pyrophosphorylase|nr:thiamine phosphate synthase [Paludibacter sp.]